MAGSIDLSLVRDPAGDGDGGEWGRVVEGVGRGADAGGGRGSGEGSVGEHEEVGGGVGGVGPKEEAVGGGVGGGGREPVDSKGGPLKGVGEDEVVEVGRVLLPHAVILRRHGGGF